jgi:hypothetical protein
VGAAGQSLKVSDPVVGAVRRFFEGEVARFCEVKGFDGSEARRVAVAALIGKIAAELLAAALFGGDGGSVNDVLGPTRGGLERSGRIREG